MPANRILPDKITLQHWIEDEGMTHQQIADRIFETTGERVGRSAVSVAAHRYGITKPGNRYKDYLPWRVSTYHIRAYPFRMLRLMGRRDTKGPESLNEQETAMLDGWLEMLDREKAVVGYDPEDDQGVHYISAKYKDHDGLAPIRIKKLHLKT
jgi:hypothetical protein